MNKQDRKLLEKLANFLYNIGAETEREEFDDKTALVLTYAVDDETLPEECTVTIEHPAADLTAIQMMISVFYDLDEKTTEEAAKLLPIMNSILEMGCFGVIRSEGCVYFNYAFIVDGLDDSGMIISTVTAFDIITQTAREGRNILAPLVVGDKKAEDYNNDDALIVQI